ncbi:hypothetical protein SY88_04175 [Clostridiales bacterium PH28_bin88]|nr:hypothetical protein SY88_04175 [Clostridiales bacterium PH28_bin88]
MNFVFRVDASVQIGSGHLMRCLTLADALCRKGARVSFVCHELPGNFCDFVENKGCQVHRLPYTEQHVNDAYRDLTHVERLRVDWQSDAEQTQAVLKKDEEDIDWLIVDHYSLDHRWETYLRPLVKKIMVIDDLADRSHDCDLLLDQNLYQNIETRYEGLVPKDCRKLLGPQYALLRPQFRAARKNLRKRNGSVKRILIFFGGSDPANETTKALEAIRLLNRWDIAVDAVVGGANPHVEQVKRLCSVMPNVNFYCQVDNMAQLMADADLAIGAGGSATWERCILGLPSITLVVAPNQLEATASVAGAGATWNLGWSSGVSPERLMEAVKKAIDNPEALKEMGERAMRLMESVSIEGEVAVVQALREGNHATA